MKPLSFSWPFLLYENSSPVAPPISGRGGLVGRTVFSIGGQWQNFSNNLLAVDYSAGFNPNALSTPSSTLVLTSARRGVLPQPGLRHCC
jgi:hypothetical protein